MGRVARTDIGNHVYHVINRAVGRFQIFNGDEDYRMFQEMLLEAKEMVDMRILSFSLMPNHWHLQLYPENDGDMGEFMHWITNAHTRRVHALTETIGTGPLYQGRYKSFLIQKDEHLLAVLKYIERNPVRAKMVKTPEKWRWGSAQVRLFGSPKMKKILSESPVPLPRNYQKWIREPDKEDDLEEIRGSAQRGTPLGRSTWVENMINQYSLQATARRPGRPASH
ncbi:hypothetical protein A2766_02635 [Candidatus Kaiserbacteria bacterium RIFCSPHIGHO2_01_FULL_58_22]|uniref:Transposase IS200-like domain-containing protein n=1 Tax=Candidatus Kaiserbacteria bacterium GW2011_GWA2_58_9 TaxID=1618672 RepID=A0A0G1YXH3_9BACT|nr:MAG: hypothetical protein UY98_C0001G0028 [Candidatus Kaiserbacteria bacterium GW2011_GWA2_58_9]OGG63085.1 MAG: hypothetical protein A2766_02635 [Candidatus Kaiserbacteria bacterium RIFCSPHIGHO2_01_FULL_58_22]